MSQNTSRNVDKLSSTQISQVFFLRNFRYFFSADERVPLNITASELVLMRGQLGNRLYCHRPTRFIWANVINKCLSWKDILEFKQGGFTGIIYTCI